MDKEYFCDPTLSCWLHHQVNLSQTSLIMSKKAYPDAQIFPHATGVAEGTVAKHQKEENLKLYAGWFCQHKSPRMAEHFTDFSRPIRSARLVGFRREEDPLPIC
jgi:hypothetical protein